MNLKPETSFENFQTLDIRVGEIVEVIKVPKKDKLYVFTVDFGFDKPKTIVSAIAHLVTEQELLNVRTCFILNFPPRNIAGIISEGMILVSEKDGKLFLTANKNTPIGAIV
jgi:methionyl-tRNA synthetase